MKSILSAALLVLLATSAVADSAYVPSDKERSRWTWADMNNWRAVLGAYHADMKQYPDAGDIETLRKLVEPVYIRHAATTDAWGRAFQYALTENGFRLTSAGADGKYGTADDMSLTPESAWMKCTWMPAK